MIAAACMSVKFANRTAYCYR